MPLKIQIFFRLFYLSFRANQLWTFSHNFLGYDPIRGDFDVAGLQYQWNDGIFSITLGNRNPDGFKTAYFHAMASISEFMVSTEVLKNQTLSARSNHGKDFKVSVITCVFFYYSESIIFSVNKK